MRYLLMIVLFVSFNVTSNPYKEYLRADEDERFEMLYGENPITEELFMTYQKFKKNLRYAVPTTCNNLISVSPPFGLSEVYDDYAFFEPCEISFYWEPEIAKKHYHSGIVYNDGKAFVLQNHDKLNVYYNRFYLRASRVHENEIKAMTQSAERYSVVLYTQSRPAVRVY